MPTGADYVREGRALFPEIYTDTTRRREAGARLAQSAQTLMRSDCDKLRSLGFLLFGMSEAAGKGVRRGN
jgi:hypothetical protein